MIFAGRNNVSILLTMGATVIALPLVMGQEARPAQSQTAPDAGGKIQKTFKSKKVHFEDLSSRLLQDSFDGGAVFLATFEKPVLLNDARERLQGRIEQGMFAVIVNPLEKWSGLDRDHR